MKTLFIFTGLFDLYNINMNSNIQENDPQIQAQSQANSTNSNNLKNSIKQQQQPPSNLNYPKKITQLLAYREMYEVLNQEEQNQSQQYYYIHGKKTQKYFSKQSKQKKGIKAQQQKQTKDQNQVQIFQQEKSINKNQQSYQSIHKLPNASFDKSIQKSLTNSIDNCNDKSVNQKSIPICLDEVKIEPQDSVQIIQGFKNQKKKRKARMQKDDYPRSSKDKQIITQKIAKSLTAYFNYQKQYSLQSIARRLGLSARRVQKARIEYFETKMIQITQEQQSSRRSALSQKFKEAGEFIAQILKKNPTISANGIKQQLTKMNFPIPRSINYILHQQGFIYKRLDYATFSKNTPDVIEERYHYCQKIKDLNNQQLLYIAQSIFNVSTSIYHGWIRKNQSANFKAPQNPDNISVLAVANCQGLLSYIIKRGGISEGDVFDMIIKFVLPSINDKDIMVVGNLKLDSAGEIKNYFRQHNIPVLDLPSFSPQLNPLESFFSAVKANFRRIRQQKRLKTSQQMEKGVSEIFEIQKLSDLSKNYKKMRENVRLGLKRLNFEHCL